LADAIALAIALGACSIGNMGASYSTPFSSAQCRDLTAIRRNAPVTREQNMTELAALEAAGYHPGWSFDPYYPADLEAAQRKVDLRYTAERPQT
jgi:hypothetical protein